jgi:hypothetical protein
MDERQQQFTPPAPKPGYEICKRIFDIVMSAMALILLSPLFLITALAVWVQDGGNPIYSQLAKIMAVMSLIMIFYNSALRTEAGYIMYFVLALPFIRRKSPHTESIT